MCLFDIMTVSMIMSDELCVEGLIFIGKVSCITRPLVEAFSISNSCETVTILMMIQAVAI